MILISQEDQKNDDFYDIMLDDNNAKRQDISENYIDLLRPLVHIFWYKNLNFELISMEYYAMWS